MEEDVEPVKSIEVERRYYGNRWDKVLTLLIDPAGDRTLKDYNITPDQAQKLADNIIELVRIAEPKPAPDGAAVTAES